MSRVYILDRFCGLPLLAFSSLALAKGSCRKRFPFVTKWQTGNTIAGTTEWFGYTGDQPTPEARITGVNLDPGDKGEK